METQIVQVAGAEVSEIEAWLHRDLHVFNETFLGPYGNQRVGVVAMADGQRVGGICGGVHLGWLSLDIVYLDEKFHRRGLGSQMVLALEAEARKLGATRVFVDTTGFQAEGFYARHGYQEWGRFTDFAPGVDRIYMRKDEL